MTIKLFNTLTKEKEVFKPMKENELSMYACGPTVYNYIHIGNARMAVFFDVVRRFFEYKGYKVTYVQNITDVDDKIINASKELGIAEKEISEKFTKEYNEDLKSLHVLPSTIQPKVTEHIDEIIGFIKELIKKEYAYVLNGDVYFRVQKFNDYLKLSNQKLEQLKHTERELSFIAKGKEYSHDFALWKTRKENEVSWDSPWGKGRPGWHIECSVMSMKYLGETFDIHGGGLDLCFPHHDNEIAQSEALTGKPFANYWLHNNYITVDGQKMSKSLGNFTTVRDALEEYDGNTIRMFFLSKNYRNLIDYSNEALNQAKLSIEKIQNFFLHLSHLQKVSKTSLESETVKELVKVTKNEILSYLSDDFNTSEAITSLLGLIKEIYSLQEVSKEDAKTVSLFLEEMLFILGFEFKKAEEGLDEELEKLIKERDNLKNKAKNEKEKDKKLFMFKKADEIREKLKEKGIVLEDTPEGTRWKREVE